MLRIISSFLLLILIPSFSNAQTQICWVVQDSIYTGVEATGFSVYHYDNWQLVAIEHTDSGFSMVTSIDSVLYGSNGKVSMVRSYDGALTSIFNITTLSYDINDRISRIHVHEDDGFSTSDIAHDVSYNGAGEITDIKVDPSSIVGNPDGFPFNFEDLVWQGGNVISLSLVGDIIGNGHDTIELSIISDTMINIQKDLPIIEVGELIESSGQNNLMRLVTVNDEDIGPAGTLALNRTYMYNTDKTVRSRLNLSAAFNSDVQGISYKHQCSGIGIRESSIPDLEIYPNPVTNILNIESPNIIQTIKLIELNGQELIYQEVISNSHKLDLSNLDSGIYVLEVQGEKTIDRKKIFVD